MRITQDTTTMLRGRVRGGRSDAKGVLLYTDRAWGAARIEEDGTTSASGGPLVLPSWLGHAALRPLRAMVLFRRAGAAAHGFWERSPDTDDDGGGGDQKCSRFGGLVAVTVLLVVAGLAAAVPGALVPAWPLREAAQGVTLFLLHLGAYLLIRFGDGTRVPMLHGAEHMGAACLDEGEPLTRTALSRFPACHRLCGSNLMVTLHAVGTVVHVALGFLPLGLFPAIALRLVALPFILVAATVAHRLLARLWDVPVIGAIAIPGRYVQRLSVAQPDAAALEVAMASARALMAADCAAAPAVSAQPAERLAA